MINKLKIVLAVVLASIALLYWGSKLYTDITEKAYNRGYSDAYIEVSHELNRRPSEPIVMVESNGFWTKGSANPYPSGYVDGYNDGYFKALEDYNVEHGNINRFEMQ